MSSQRVLIDHDEIQRWAEARGAKPATVASTETDEDVGIIRLDFPGYSGEGKLAEVDWDEWFDKFDESGLALIVQEKTADGKKSNFNKLVKRESVEDQIESSPSRSKRGSKRASANG